MRGIYEHSPWVAEQVAEIACGYRRYQPMLAVLWPIAWTTRTTEQQLALIRAHPDLAGKAQVAGELTADSSDEQASAGLDQCSPRSTSGFRR